MNTTIKSTLMLLMAATVIWACTVQTEDDSVPGNGKGWGGLYYYYTPYTGYLVDGKHMDFAGSDDSITSHALVAEGVVGFCKDFYAKVDLPYSLTKSRLSTQTEIAEETFRGLGDALLAVKWVFVNSSDGPRVGALLGLAVPTGDENEGLSSEVYSPKATFVGGMPVGCGRLYGGLGYQLIPEKDGYDAGDVISYTLTYDLLAGKFSFPLEIWGNLAMKAKQDGHEITESGSHFVVISPCLTYTPVVWATICAGVIVPVLKQGYATDYSYQPHLTFFYNF